MIALRQMGRTTFLTRYLCGADGKYSCDKVLQDGNVFGKWVLEDIGVIYFGAQFLFLWISSCITGVGPDLDLPAIISLLCLPFTGVLLVYQGFFIKSWCKICLFITGILWAQAAIFAWTLSQGEKPGQLWLTTLKIRMQTDTVLLLMACICLSLSWLVIKPLIKRSGEIGVMRKLFSKLKHDPALFHTLLERQIKTISHTDFADDFTFGNQNAIYRLIVVLNPYCKPCAEDFFKIYALLKESDKDFGVTFRFMTDPTRIHQTATRILLGGCLAEPVEYIRLKMLRDWFTTRKLKVWRTKWNVQGNFELNDTLVRHQDWCRSNGITYTPVVFINGKGLPEPFQLSDLKYLIRS
jgi:hypothetical protein